MRAGRREGTYLNDLASYLHWISRLESISCSPRRADPIIEVVSRGRGRGGRELLLASLLVLENRFLADDDEYSVPFPHWMLLRRLLAPLEISVSNEHGWEFGSRGRHTIDTVETIPRQYLATMDLIVSLTR